MDGGKNAALALQKLFFPSLSERNMCTYYIKIILFWTENRRLAAVNKSTTQFDSVTIQYFQAVLVNMLQYLSNDMQT